MNRLVSVSSKAFKDAEKIRNWYDERLFNAGDKFPDELNYFINKINNNPYQYKKVNEDIRRCLMNVFPHIIYFTFTDKEIVILRIRHKHQRPLKRFS